MDDKARRGRSRSPARGTFLERTSIKVKLAVLAGTGALVALVVGSVGLVGIGMVDTATSRATETSRAARTALAQTHSVEELQLVIYAALSRAYRGQSADDLEQRFREQMAELEARTSELDDTLLAVGEKGVGPTERDVLTRFGLDSKSLVIEVLTNGTTTDTRIAENEALAGQISKLSHQRDTALLGLSVAAASKARATKAKARALGTVLQVVGLVILALLSFVIARSILASLARMRTGVEAIMDGDLDTRIDVRGTDELATLGYAFNATADSVGELLGRLSTDAERDSFARELTDAFEMADTETDAYRVVERAMVKAAPGKPMELLLSDSSRAHLDRVAQSEGVEPPDCSAETPFGCVAVRRGHGVVFPSSDALNACPRLQGRRDEAISACCAPVSFMGRSLGVLHAVGEEGATWTPAAVERVRMLAAQTATRIGTLRSFERSHLQASTDSLTGLLNRRAFESEARRLLRSGQPVALAIGDLDKFKLLNDTYGHEVGDTALKLFATTLAATVRGGDVVARLGGEEFAVVLPGATREIAAQTIDRVRTELEFAGIAQPPAVTVSFGVSDSSQAEDVSGLLRIADLALYRAKADGRNRVVVASDADVTATRDVKKLTPAALAAVLADDPLDGHEPSRV